MVAELARQLRRCGVLTNGVQGPHLQQCVLLGVSGGPDSVALLMGMLAIAQRRSTVRAQGLRLVAAHVHHHLRPSADEDARLVNEICGRFGVEVHTEHVRPGELDGNLSANARLMRYEALLKIARRVGACHVAVAHHGEDQLETILMALGRGAGIDGLSGMPWVRPLWDGVMLIRPLLGVRKADCEELCRRAKIEWHDDSGNLDPRRTRGRLRREVIPVLEALWPDLPRRISCTAEVLEAAREALELRIEQLFGSNSKRRWDRVELARQPLPILCAGLRRAALEADARIADDLNQRHLLQAAEAIRSSDRRPHVYHWPGRLELKVTAKLVSLSKSRRST